jgi:hypothetical protein
MSTKSEKAFTYQRGDKTILTIGKCKNLFMLSKIGNIHVLQYYDRRAKCFKRHL